MRTFFLLLVAVNAGFFAWMQYYATPEGASDPGPMRRQVNPGNIRVLTGPELAGLPPLPPKPKAAATAEPPTAAAGSCVEWGGFSVAEAPRAEQVLEPLALGSRLTQRRSEEKASWWVFIPPQPNRSGAQKKAAELKSLGVGEYFIVQEDGPLRWSVSLGVFSSEDAAKARLEALRAKGVRSAQTGARDTQVTKIWFQVRGADAALQSKLKSFAQALPGTDIHDCP